MTDDPGKPPEGGWQPLVTELLVTELEKSLAFWRDLLGFSIAYQRTDERFVYLQGHGAQIMLCQRHGGWETGPLVQPFGRGVMFQLKIAELDAMQATLAAANWPLYAGPRVARRQTGDRESAQREIFVLDPDGYLLMLSEPLDERSD